MAVALTLFRANLRFVCTRIRGNKRGAGFRRSAIQFLKGEEEEEGVMEAKQATTTAYGGGGDPFGNTLGSPQSENGQGMGGSVTDRRTDGRPFGREEEV